MYSLKPCPVCRSRATLVEAANGYWILCAGPDCIIRSHLCDSELDLVDAWNAIPRRAEPSIGDQIAEIAAEVPSEARDELPRDLSSRFRYYAHGGASHSHDTEAPAPSDQGEVPAVPDDLRRAVGGGRE